MKKIYNISISKKSNIINIKLSENFQENNEEFDEMFQHKYIFQQNFFCLNQKIFNNTLIEDKIKLVKINLDNIKFDMFVYKTNDWVSNRIIHEKYWEYQETINVLSCLSYYSKVKNIPNHKIFIIDIGANIGWYSILFGKIGYNIISFEPSKINYYLLLKNFCLNKEINMIIINKGLDIDKNKSILYHSYTNFGNGLIINDYNHSNFKNFTKEEVEFSKLNDYITYFPHKNFALIKLDIEGGEANALKSGIDFIIKYHIPFILMEFNKNLLTLRDTNPKSLLQLLVNNGYKISTKDFLSKKYTSINQIIKLNNTNIYLTNQKFLKL